jgi:hypothetical protein
MTLPNFLVIGAQRAGTTLLHQILDAHPEVFVPYRRKEVHYFDWHFSRGTAWYERFFPDADQAKAFGAIGEATPDYLFEPSVPLRIFQTLPSCRFVVSLRNPVDRAYSWYLYSLRCFAEQRSIERFFEESEETLARGLYSQQLNRYFELFPRDSFLILILEDLVEDPATNLGRLADFLNLSTSWPDAGALVRDRVNASEVPRFRRAFARAQRFGEMLTRHDLDWAVRQARRMGVLKLFGSGTPKPSLPASTRLRLQIYYRHEIESLEDLLGRNLRVWTSGCPDRAPITGGGGE